MSCRLLRVAAVVQRGSCRRSFGSVTGQQLHHPTALTQKRASTDIISRPRCYDHQQCRHIVTDVLPGVLVPPAVFTGLVLTLWTYKCLMMVVFQNKIIYMPSVPPFSRSERLSDYERVCRPVTWREERIRAADGTAIALCVGSIGAGRSERNHQDESAARVRHVVVLFFQGNASSLPLRVPFLSDVLKQLHKSPPAPTHAPVKYTLAALSYRGFWTSKGRATQPGIELDAAAALEWVNRTYNPIDNTGEDVRVVMWGQSIGAGVATTTTAQYLRRPHEASSSASSNPGSVLQAKSPARKANFDISALILETPFTSIRSMLVALYPQKWLPYRYLWPFLRSWWDSERALREIAAVSCDSDPKRSHHKKPTVLILQAGRDEIVPPEQGPGLESLCQTLGLDVERVVVGGALHTEVLARREGRDGVCGVLRRVGEAAEQEEE